MPPNTSRANVFGLTDVSDGAPTVRDTEATTEPIREATQCTSTQQPRR
jgi:hypothetical protein